MCAAASRARSHRTENDVIAGVSAIGFPIFDRAGRPVVALSLAMSSNRMRGSYRKRALDASHEQVGSLRESLLQRGVVAHEHDAVAL
jgi:DNA-binding IclR family transcriptional regulator